MPNRLATSPELSLSQRVTSLSNLSKPGLCDLWQQLFKKEPPPEIRKDQAAATFRCCVARSPYAKMEVQEMNKRRVEKSETHKPQPLVHGKHDNQYPGVHGKVVDWVEHKFEDGILHLDVRFTDKTALSWSLATAIVIREAHLSDWKTGDLKLLRPFVQNESDWE